EAPSLYAWLDGTLQLCNGDAGSRVLMLCWALWSARNDIIWKQRIRSVREVVMFSNSTHDQWLKAQGKGNIPSLSPIQQGDATAGCKIGRVSPELAEVMGIREALSWIKTNDYSQVVIEADNRVCEAIRSFAVLVSAFGLVVDECKKIINNLSHVSLVFVKRSVNRAAHFIARNSRILVEPDRAAKDVEDENPDDAAMEKAGYTPEHVAEAAWLGGRICGDDCPSIC
uniref:RNase H type-1 domain-containing protein n=1 Tax=Cannabis sativa TaxID=3483 RepID=A0A803QSW2_CANSA